MRRSDLYAEQALKREMSEVANGPGHGERQGEIGQNRAETRTGAGQSRARAVPQQGHGLAWVQLART